MNKIITPKMIEKCQEILKKGDYDLDKLVLEVASRAPCSVVQGLFPEILDMALEHLKRKASHSLVEWMDPHEISRSNKDVIFEPNTTMIVTMKNHALEKYDWSMVK